MIKINKKAGFLGLNFFGWAILGAVLIIVALLVYGMLSGKLADLFGLL